MVIRTAPRTLPRQNLLQRLLRGVTAEAKKYRISVRKGSDGVEALTKYENARQVAEHFPVLVRSLPPPRKPWEGEDYRMSMFTAATLAIAELNIGRVTSKQSQILASLGLARRTTTSSFERAVHETHRSIYLLMLNHPLLCRRRKLKKLPHAATDDRTRRTPKPTARRLHFESLGGRQPVASPLRDSR
jgi:hypothetical protein